MVTPVPLRSLRVRGLTSIGDLTLDLASGVTLLVGANGSGKSNIVSAFELMGRILDGQLNDYLVKVGGIGTLLHKSVGAGDAESIELEAWGEWTGDLSNGYRASVFPTSGDAGAVDETTYFHDRFHYPDRPRDERLGLRVESALRERSISTPSLRYALEVMAGCRVFHFDDTSDNAPPKMRADVADGLTLRPDARNLAAVLLELQERDQPTYQRIVRAIRTVAPFFDDFVLRSQSGNVLLRWKERQIDGLFSADALSDGTLRFVCLATLLLQPSPPTTIILDEPELGLHPFAIHQLAALMRGAATRRKIVAATQSVTLLGHFSVADVAVVDRAADGTVVQRPDPASLAEWLDDYSLGELWEKNLLGGRPQPAHPARRLG